MLTRKRQVVSKIETSEGVAETLAVADAKTLAYNPRISFDPEMFPRNPVRLTFTNIGKVVGKRPGALNFGLELRGSGAAATPPDWGKHFQNCGCGVSLLRSINIGAVTAGPFVHGETITGGTSGGKGRVIINTANGASAIYYVVVSGTIQSGEVITGGTSGASATTSSSPTTIGNVIEPITDSIPSQTMSGYEDGIRKLLRGCRGKFKINFKSGEPVLANFEYMGVEAGIADVSLFTNPVYETTKPPAFLNASFSMDAYSAKIASLEINQENKLAPRDDVNNDRGLLSYLITDRDVNGSYDPEMVLVASHDFHSKWFGGTEMALDTAWGTVAGNKFRFFAPRAQYTKVEDEERDGIAVAKSSFDLNGSLLPGNDEWALLCL